jgi:hypothetical protein
MSRARLECGVKLNINRMVQSGAIQPGSHIWCRTAWPNTYSGKLTAIMESEISGNEQGWFRTQIAEIGLDQRINLVSCPRHSRLAVVLHLSNYEPPRVGALDAAGRTLFRLSATMGAQCRLPPAVCRP